MALNSGRTSSTRPFNCSRPSGNPPACSSQRLAFDATSIQRPKRLYLQKVSNLELYLVLALPRFFVHTSRPEICRHTCHMGCKYPTLSATFCSPSVQASGSQQNLLVCLICYVRVLRMVLSIHAAVQSLFPTTCAQTTCVPFQSVTL